MNSVPPNIPRSNDNSIQISQILCQPKSQSASDRIVHGSGPDQYQQRYCTQDTLPVFRYAVPIQVNCGGWTSTISGETEELERPLINRADRINAAVNSNCYLTPREYIRFREEGTVWPVFPPPAPMDGMVPRW